MTLKSATGTITSATSSVVSGLSGENQMTVVLFYGTYAGVSCAISGSNDGTNWFPLAPVNTATMLPVNTGTIVLATNQTVAYFVQPGTTQRIRVLASAWSSGTCNVEIYNGGTAALPNQTEQVISNSLSNCGMANIAVAAGVGSTNVQLYTGPGILQGYVTTTASTASLSFYDSASTSVGGLAPIYTSAAVDALGTVITLGLPFTNGLVAAKASGSEACTVSYTPY